MIFIDPITCLAAAIYFEARGENISHQLMVANTVMNRVKSQRFPDDVCGVVKQRYQFSFYWDGIKEEINDAKSWEYSTYWAKQVISKQIEYHDGCHYARKEIRRVWMKDMSREVHGNHAFYEGGC